MEEFTGAPGFTAGGVTEVQDALRLNLNWFNGGPELSGQLGSVITACAAIAAGYAKHVLCFRSVWEGTAHMMMLGDPHVDVLTTSFEAEEPVLATLDLDAETLKVTEAAAELNVGTVQSVELGWSGDDVDGTVQHVFRIFQYQIRFSTTEQPPKQFAKVSLNTIE